MRNGSAGSCPPLFVAFSHLPTSTSARTLTSPSRTTSRYRLVKGGNRRSPVQHRMIPPDALRIAPAVGDDEHRAGVRKVACTCRAPPGLSKVVGGCRDCRRL